MEILSSFYLILALLILIYQGLSIVKYFTTIAFGKQLMQSKSWNKYYDPIIAFLLTSFLVVTVLLTQSLHKNLESEDYSMLFDLFLILLINTFFSLLFFGRKKLIQIKSKEQIEDEQVEQVDRIKTEIQQAKIVEENRYISKKLFALEKWTIEGVSELSLKADRNINDSAILKDKVNIVTEKLLNGSNCRNVDENSTLVDAEIICQNLKDIIKTNSDEIIKSLKPNKSVGTKTNNINYNSSFSETQIIFLWGKLRKYHIIHDDCLVEEFSKSFLINKIGLKMDSISLYWFHKEIDKLILDKVKLTSFISYFKNEQNRNFVEGTVRNGVSTPKHKLLQTFKNIFDDFPL